MRFLFLAIILLCFSFPSYAAMTDYPEVRIRALDKSTARTKTMRVRIGSTVEFGSLFIKPQACRKSDPLSKPENASFVQVWEIPLGKTKSEWIFSGWMFSSSPAVSAMDHAVYDVWVLECLDPNEKPAKQANKIVVKTDDGEETIDDLEALTEPAENPENIENPADPEGSDRPEITEPEVVDSEAQVEEAETVEEEPEFSNQGGVIKRVEAESFSKTDENESIIEPIIFE